ncbi:hypothetical protein [Corynebacterium coyleae]|uniref:Uncharacterized protein n=1 Tax=Corynebacterium coyleae TaxID=53374 RepID=A0AAP7CED8_9CORY|nr:hypothetical protein [Corynebacterium coyleae]NJJ04998.1 hypothetical protein [Corynebacterium coyleae]
MEADKTRSKVVSEEDSGRNDELDSKNLSDFEFDARLAESIFSFTDFARSCFRASVLCVCTVPVTALAAYNVGVLLAPPVHKIPSLAYSDSLRSALEPTDPSSCDLLEDASYPPSAAFSANFDTAICSDLFRFASVNISYGDIWSIWAAVVALLVAVSVFKNTLNRTYESHLARAENYVAEVLDSPAGTTQFPAIESGEPEGIGDGGNSGNTISKRRIEQFFRAVRSYQFWRVGLVVAQLLGLLWMFTLSNIFVGSELAESLMENQNVKDFAPPEDSINGIRVAYELVKQGMHPRYLTLHMVGLLMLVYLVAEAAQPLSASSAAGLSKLSRLADRSRLFRLESAIKSLGTPKFSTCEWRISVVGIALVGWTAFRLALWRAGVAGGIGEKVLLFACCVQWVATNQWIGRRIANRLRWVEPDLGFPSYWGVMRVLMFWLFSLTVVAAAVQQYSADPVEGLLIVLAVPVFAIGLRSCAGWLIGKSKGPCQIWGIRSIVNRYDRMRLDGLKAEKTDLLRSSH